MPASSASGRSDYRVRLAVADDASEILRLIRGLAEYEKAPEEVINTVEQLTEDGWGSTPRFTAFVAESESESEAESLSDSSPRRCVAFALTYFAYSTWKGVCLYLEDIYVEPHWRGRGVGMALIAQCVDFAHSRRCQRVMWQALDWNTPAVDFYVRKLGATVMKEWLSLRLTKDAIDAFRQRVGAAADADRASDGSDDGTQPAQQQPSHSAQQEVSEADMSTLS